jgi:hypothetical protein
LKEVLIMKRSKLRLIVSVIILVILLQAAGRIFLRAAIIPNVKLNARANILFILILLIADIVNIIHIFVGNRKQSKFEAVGREATPSSKPVTMAEKKTELESGNPLGAENGAFVIVIDKVISKQGRGTYVQGTVKGLGINVGDAAYIVKNGGSAKATKVNDIRDNAESSAGIRNRAENGEKVVLLLQGIAISDVAKGDVLSARESFKPSTLLAKTQDTTSLTAEGTANESGLKKVTIYMGHRAAGQLMTRFMNPNEIDTMLGKLADQALAQRIRIYAKKHEVEQKMLNIQVPNITSQEEFAAFVNRAFPETSRPPYADIGVVLASVICYFIVVEKATPSSKPAAIPQQPANAETVGNPRVVDLRSEAEKKIERESGNALEAEHEAFAQELFSMFKTSRPYDSMALLKEVTEKYSPTAQKIAAQGYNPALKKIYYRVMYLCKKEGIYFHSGTLDNIFDGEYWSK